MDQRAELTPANHILFNNDEVDMFENVSLVYVSEITVNNIHIFSFHPSLFT